MNARFSYSVMVGTLLWVLLAVTGCASSPGYADFAEMPRAVRDGESKIRVESSFSAVEYSGHLVNSKPNGLGRFDFWTNGGGRQHFGGCYGRFGEFPSDFTNTSASTLGEGVIDLMGAKYVGPLTVNLVLGLGCVGFGSGEFKSREGWVLRSSAFNYVNVEPAAARFIVGQGANISMVHARLDQLPIEAVPKRVVNQKNVLGEDPLDIASSYLIGTDSKWVTRYKDDDDPLYRIGMTAGICTIISPSGSTWEGACGVPVQDRLDSTYGWNGGFVDGGTVGWRRYSVVGAGYSINELKLLYSDNLKNKIAPAFLQLGFVEFPGFNLANGVGQMSDGVGGYYLGSFEQGTLVDGFATALDVGGQYVHKAIVAGKPEGFVHLAPKSYLGTKPCGYGGWILFKGVCESGAWHGDVVAYSANGYGRIVGRFDRGAPIGEIAWSDVVDQLQIKGEMAVIKGNIGFLSGRAYFFGDLYCEGSMKGFEPNGVGICKAAGSLEKCEFASGERIDSLYKNRLENDKLRAELAERDETQRLERERVEARQRQAMAEAQSNAGGGMLDVAIKGYAGGLRGSLLRQEVVKAAVSDFVNSASSSVVVSNGASASTSRMSTPLSVKKSTLPPKFNGVKNQSIPI